MTGKINNDDLPKDGMTRDYLYEILEGDGQPVIRIVSFLRNKTALKIPEKINNIPVTEIGGNAFRVNDKLRSLFIPAGIVRIGIQQIPGCFGLENIIVDTKNSEYSSIDGILFDKKGETLIYYPFARKGSYRIPPGVLRIGPHAFSDRSNLDGIVLPDGLLEIGGRAFENCAFGGSLDLPSSLREIGSHSFFGCSSITSVTIPPITEIPECSFGGCRSLASVVISDGVRAIDGFAFDGCGSLVSVTIPESVKSIEWFAFKGCDSLESVVIPLSVEHIDKSAFEGCEKLNKENIFRDGVFYDRTGETLVACLREKAGTCVIPEGVTVIRNGAFRDCLKLRSIVFPKSLYSIGGNAFINCPNLDKATIAEIKQITDKEKEAVKDLKYLFAYEAYTLHLDKNTCDITGYRGQGGHVEIPKSIKGNKVIYIEIDAFKNQESISSVTIPDTVTHIMSCAFEGCTGLKEITIPFSVATINNDAFESCVNLEKINVDENNECYTSIDGVLFDKKGETLLCYPAGKTDLFGPPPQMKHIQGRNDAFSLKMKLSGRDRAGINGLIHRVYPDWGMEKIDGQTVRVTKYVEAGGVWIISSEINGARVTEIGECVFAESRFVPEETEVPAGIISIRSDSFTGERGLGVEALTAVTVDPANLVYRSIGGVVFNKEADTLVCFPGGKKGPYVIPESVQKIGKGAFLGCRHITSIVIQEKVTEIPCETLALNANLKEINVDPENRVFRSIDGVLFSKDAAVLFACPAGRKGKYRIPNGVKVINEDAFINCVKLNSIVIPNGVQEIKTGAFADCAGLVSIALPESVVSIEEYAFARCENLKSISLPSGLKHIGEKAFSDCHKLSEKFRDRIRRRFGEEPFHSVNDTGFYLDDDDALQL
jgi:hypothetical protein